MSINSTNSNVVLPNSGGDLRNTQTVKRLSTPDELIRLAQPKTVEHERLLRDLSQLVHDHPTLLWQLAELVRSRLTDNRAASVHEAFERLRWDMHLHMGNNICPLLARLLLCAYPALNGRVRLVPVPLDDALGMRVSDRKLPGDYARRLEWCDGRPLTEQPPLRKKQPQSVTPIQGELFEVAG